MVRIYRDSFGMFACNGIMYNHESPRRGENFVTRKICMAAAAIKAGQQKELLIGDTSAQRDWGWAPDFVRGMWLSLQHSEPGDYVFATGELHSVQDVVETAFGVVGLDWKQFVRKDPRFLRPAEPQRLVGNPAKAAKVLGWKPEVKFSDLIRRLTEAELAGQRA
jgi:GDPmannose 4,6-dehydratase